MKKLLVLLSVLWSLVCSAQPTTGATYLTSPNLLTKTWTGTVPGVAGGVSGGPTPAYNSSTDTIIFSYAGKSVYQTYAFNQALQNAGLAIGGYDYSWKINNSGSNTGTLTGKFTLNGTNGTALQTYNYTYNDSTGGTDNFITYSGTQWFPQNHSSKNIAGFTMEWSGQDNRYWAGYWGPRVREPSIALRYIVDACAANPMSSPDCPGYQQALLDQQCTANPLYSTACPGYAAAYQTQQCTINPLYNAQCPGYQTAYFNQQCTANPLYATTCPGYATAYKTQQCTDNPLYATDCPGYAQAYKTQQCNLTALYATDCPGYEQAYLNAQCIRDSLYSKLCSGYATAYAIKYLVPLDSTTTSAVNGSLSSTAAVKASDPVSINTNGTVSTTPSATGNSTVDNVIAAPSTTSATSPTSVNSVVNAPPAPGAGPTANAVTQASSPPPPPALAVQQERASENKKTDTAVASVEKKSGGNPEAAKKEATERAKELANNMSKAATMEAQTASQGLVVGLMAYVPGFSAYQNSIIPDALGAQLARQYSKPNVDNRSAQRQLSGSNEYRWKEMVDSQYNKGN